MEESNEHTNALTALLGKVIGAEQEIAECKRQENLLEARKRDAEKAMQAAWDGIAALMAESGEYEVLLPGRANDYRISYGAARESVQVADADAVPDAFVRLERKPLKKEIGEHLKALRESGEAMPNWATLEKGERKLGYRLVKKGAA